MSGSKKKKRHIPHLPPEAFSEMECKFRDGHDTLVLDPQAMVAIVEAYQHLSALANSVVNTTESELNEWREHFDPDYNYPTYDLSGLAIPPPDECDWEEWSAYAQSKYEQATGKKIVSSDYDALTEEHWKILFDFWTCPTQSLADSHPWLREIPDVVRKAQLFDVLRQRNYARFAIDHLTRPLCLTFDDITPPKNLLKSLKGTLQCWMFLVTDDEGLSEDEMDNASLLRFSAVFVDTGTGGKPVPVAVITGYYVVPFKDGNVMDEATFMMLMDARSCYLNDVWKAIVGTFLPKHNWECLEEFHQEYGDYNASCEAVTSGMAAVTLDVHPAYQGMKLSKFLLDVVTEMTAYADSRDFLVPDDFDPEQVPDNSIANAPIRLYVLAIEGTEPEPGQLSPQTYLAYIPSAIAQPRKVVNAGVERRRLKLTKYFNDIGEKSERYSILTYNPWDYPVT